MSTSRIKPMLVAPLRITFRLTAGLRECGARLYFHAALAARLHRRLPASVVVLGRSFVYGSGDVNIGDNCLLYPDLHLETQGNAAITLGEGAVLSRGVHIVAMAGVTIGRGCMIGEYTSIRDANHARVEGAALRDAGHITKPILLGEEVWVGRGVTILGGITIGDRATVGANAVVTRDVAAGDIVGGVPAISLKKQAAS
jgi:acetyltransferase-like isoleucine patch superfamily enzyme